jgi:predicted unusual protein kinase regulating ubiquinone biosynthesis (AarF/ABC1/UbiB family)
MAVLALQVHAAVLSPQFMQALGWRWRYGPDVVFKVQHREMRALMDSDVANIGRLSNFVKDFLPFDPFPVKSPPFMYNAVHWEIDRAQRVGRCT